MCCYCFLRGCAAIVHGLRMARGCAAMCMRDAAAPRDLPRDQNLLSKSWANKGPKVPRLRRDMLAWAAPRRARTCSFFKQALKVDRFTLQSDSSLTANSGLKQDRLRSTLLNNNHARGLTPPPKPQAHGPMGPWIRGCAATCFLWTRLRRQTYGWKRCAIYPHASIVEELVEGVAHGATKLSQLPS